MRTLAVRSTWLLDMQIEERGVVLTLDKAVGLVQKGDVLQTNYGEWTVTEVRTTVNPMLRTMVVLGMLRETRPVLDVARRGTSLTRHP